MAKDVSPTFSEAEAANLEFVNKHANMVTYADVAQNWGDGKFSAKQIQVNYMETYRTHQANRKARSCT